MKLGYKIKPRDTKSNPTTAILAAVFVMFLISGLLLLLLALLLYKMEPGESVIKIGIVAVYVISGLCGGFLMGTEVFVGTGGGSHLFSAAVWCVAARKGYR